MRQGADYQDKVARITNFYLSQKLSYSNQQLPVTADPIDTFLFVSRRGYCEYFASSFALLLRLSGVPARLVGGYLGGEYNDLGGYYLVGENLAHVWVEALDDQGVWQRIDPSRLAVNAEQAFLPSHRQGLPSLRAFGDALQHYWSRLVLNYDLGQQFALLRQVARQVRDVKSLRLESAAALWWLLPLPLLGILFQSVRRCQRRPQRLIGDYRKQVLRCYGVAALPNRGLFALAQQSKEPLCLEFAEIYGRAYYRDQPLSPADYRRLKAILRELAGRKPAIVVAKTQLVGDNTDLRI